MRRTLIAVVLGLALVSTLIPVSSEEIQYGHAWGTSGNDRAVAVQSDSAGNVYLTGWTDGDGVQKSFVAKIDPLGNIVWDACLEVSGHILYVKDIVLSSSGDLYLCGGVDGSYGGDAFYARMTTDGNLVYLKILEGQMELTHIADDPYSNGFVLVEYYWGRVIAVGSDGSVRWSMYTSAGSSFGWSWPWGVCTDDLGNVFVVCDKDTDFGIVKFDSAGNLVRQRCLATTDPYEYTWNIIQGSDGYLYALGAVYSEGLLLVMKMTTDLDVIWCETIGNPTVLQETTEIMEAADGTLYSIGSMYAENGSGPAMFHIDRSGNLLEAVYYTGSTGATVNFMDATPMAGGGIVVAGESIGVPQTNAYPITGVVVTQIIDQWQQDNSSWDSESLTVLDPGAYLSDPAATMDDFSSTALAQAWYGMIDTKPSRLLVDVTFRQHGSNGERVSFRASASNGSSPYTYNWDFGDGATATGQRVTHTYSTGGLYSARVMVTDSMGEFGFDSVQVIVAGPPVISGLSVWPAPAQVNQTVYMQVVAADYAGSIAGFYWDFGDGTSVSTLESNVTHIYTAEGWFNITVTVTDDSGDTASTGTTLQVVEIYNLPPVVGFSSWPSEPIAGDTVYFDGSYSYDPDGWITAFHWDFGNGQSADTAFAYTVYASAGTYHPTLQVWDNYGASAVIVGWLVVGEAPPVPTDQYEPDDVWSNATSIPVGGMQVHTISSGGADVDWVTFTLAEDASVVVETSGVAGDSVVYLYNSSGVPNSAMAWDDDSGLGNWSKVTCNLTAGQYWVKVTESGQDDEIASYSIQVRVVGAGASWTMMVYMDADNNLEYAAFWDFLEMSTIGSSESVNIVVQFDRIGWYSDYGGWTTTKRFYVTQGMTPTPENALMDLGELNMGSQDTLSDFITWSMTNYPADNYMLVMWDHGGGWDGAVCWDDTDMDVVSLDELENALNISSTAVGDRVDSIAFDACLMAMSEVTYAVRDWTDVLVYSEEVMWDLGLPYDMILGDLSADPTMGAASFANCIVNRYMEYYGWDGIETISAVDVSATSPLFTAIDDLGTQLTGILNDSQYAIQYARNSTRFYYYSDYVDLYDLADELAMWIPNSTAVPALDEVRTAIANAVFAEGHGMPQEGSHGLSIYFPMGWYAGSYDALDFSADLSWSGFLKAFNGIVPAVPDAYEPDNVYTDASPISFGEMQTHSIGDLGADVDWVTFTMTNASVVTIRTSAPWGPWADTVIYLYDSVGVPNSWIAYNDDAWGDLWSRIEIYLMPGTYYVMVESYDHWGEIPEYYLELIEGSTNNPPVITTLYCSSPVTTPYTQIYFYVSAYDSDGWIDHFEWNMGDGGIIWSYSNYLYYSYSAGGLYNVTVTAVDNLGGMSSMTTTVEVLMPPVAVITMSSETGKVGVPLTFSGEDSYCPGGGTIVDYEWWFSNGGNYSTGPTATRVFLETGVYQVYLMVYDEHGLYGSATLSFAVLNPVPPVAVVSYSPARPMVGETVTFDGSYSVDPDGSIPTFIWEFGDGAVATGMVVTHEYAYADDYVVKLTVIDEDKLTDDDSASIRVVSSPVAAFESSPATPGVGQQVTFYAYGSFDELGIVEYVWAFGDGTYAQGWQVQHAYSAAGDYQVILTVTNAAGVRADVTKTVTVSHAQAQQIASGPVSPDDGNLGAGPLAISETQITVLICIALAGLVAGAEMYRRKLAKELETARAAVT